MRQKRLRLCCELFCVMGTTPPTGTQQRPCLTTLPLVIIFTDTMKFTASVIATALAVAAPSVSGTSATSVGVFVIDSDNLLSWVRLDVTV